MSRELHIFTSMRIAQHHGFVGARGTHPALPDAICWSPDREPDWLRGFELHKVHLHHDGLGRLSERGRLDFQRGITEAKILLRVPPMEWAVD